MVDGDTDAATAPRMLTALGVAPERLILEGKSRDTFENAQFTKGMVKPAPGETWLLVTSAFHMPRSMGLFRKAGFDVTPWPVDYRTTGKEGFGLAHDNPIDSLEITRWRCASGWACWPTGSRANRRATALSGAAGHIPASGIYATLANSFEYGFDFIGFCASSA